MVKIFQGDLPKTINVVVDRVVIATARFVNGIYETDNKDVIAELKRYGYEVEKIEPSKPVKEIKEPVKEVKEEPEVKPKAKPKAKTTKKKGVK